MNLFLPLILLVIANLVLYWIFFGKRKFESQMMPDSTVAGAFGPEPKPFSKDQLVNVERTGERNK